MEGHAPHTHTTHSPLERAGLFFYPLFILLHREFALHCLFYDCDGVRDERERKTSAREVVFFLPFQAEGPTYTLLYSRARTPALTHTHTQAHDPPHLKKKKNGGGREQVRPPPLPPPPRRSICAGSLPRFFPSRPLLTAPRQWRRCEGPVRPPTSGWGWAARARRGGPPAWPTPARCKTRRPRARQRRGRCCAASGGGRRTIRRRGTRCTWWWRRRRRPWRWGAWSRKGASRSEVREAKKKRVRARDKRRSPAPLPRHTVNRLSPPPTLFSPPPPSTNHHGRHPGLRHAGE